MEEEISCFLCKKQDSDCVSIAYRMERSCVKEDLMELYGDAIEHYLRNDNPVCLNCAQVLDNTVRLKRQVYEVIVDNAVNIEVYGIPSDKFFDFDNVWVSRSNNSYLFPSGLLLPSGSIQCADRSAAEGTSRYGNETPYLDREVQKMTSRGRTRRRGHRWTHRKSSRSRSRSGTSRSASRHSRSSRTTATSASRASVKKRKEQQNMEIRLKRIVGDFFYKSESLNRFTREYLKKIVNSGDEDGFEDDAEMPTVSRISVKTRFASEIRGRLLSEYEELIYECPYDSCQEIMYTLEKMTEHRVKMHNEMAMFWCEQCRFYYLTQEHLDKHKDMHFKRFIAYCIYCTEEYTNKRLYEQHLNDHLQHSFPCIYCDKFFINKQLCDAHIRTYHPGKKSRIKRIKPQSILDRIDKNQENEEEAASSNHESRDFEVRILCQHGQPEETPRLNEEDLEDVDLNLDSLVNTDLYESLNVTSNTNE